MSETKEEKEDLTQTEQPASETSQIAAFDFVRAERLSTEQEHVLSGVNEAAAQHMSLLLKEICRASVEMQALPPKEMLVADYKSQEPNNEVHIILSTMPEDMGLMLLSVDGSLALFLVDCMLGGARHSGVSARALTDLEQKVFTDATEALISQYTGAWSRLVALSPDIKPHQGKGLTQEWLDGQDHLVINEFSVKIGDLQAKMVFALLLPSCEHLVESLSSQRWASNRTTVKVSSKDKVLSVIEQVELPVSAVLGKAKISLSDLLELSAGDVICLEGDTAHRVQILTGKSPSFLGEPVTIDGHIGVRVLCDISRGGK